MSSPIVLTLTDAGKLAMLDTEGSGYNLKFSQVQLGSGNYLADPQATSLAMRWGDFPVINGEVDTANHVLRFVSSGQLAQAVKVSEIGLFDSNGVLFAVASKESGYFFQAEAFDFFTFNFAVRLDQKMAGQPFTISFNSEDIIVQSLLALHLQHINPHPQYVHYMRQVIAQHVAEADPHKQYAMRDWVGQKIIEYLAKIQAFIDLFSTFFPKKFFVGVANGSSATMRLDGSNRNSLKQSQFVLLVTPEGGHEAWNTARYDDRAVVSVFNRSGTNRVGYSGRISWGIINTGAADMGSLPDLVQAGVVSMNSGITIARDPGITEDLSQCAILINPEGAHEAWSMSKFADKFSVNVFNRSGRNRIGYSGWLSYAIFKPNNGAGESEGSIYPKQMMSGVAANGNFAIMVPAGKTWDFTHSKYAIMITPEGGHEAWSIGRQKDRFTVSVFNRSGKSRIGYSGKVSWAVFQVAE